MKRLIEALPPPADAADYSFAVEYNGPPIPYDIPRVLPIDVDRIPVAAVAPPSVALSDLPVVHPLPSPSTSLKKQLPPLPHEEPAPVPAASPTSVIENHAAIDGPDAEVSGEVGSSGVLGSSCFPDRSTEFSEVVDTSGVVGFSDELGDCVASSSELMPNRLSTESVLSMESGFDSSNDDDEAIAVQAKMALVTFNEFGHLLGGSLCLRSEELDVNIKRGACYKCLKGSRFQEKESCLACDAKYCSECLLTAMGSMPEGRKCLSCIGSPILESNREKLGKSSRLLKRLLSSREVQQLMKIEKECEANQLRPEDICVNGKKLSMEEMILLQNCSSPPPKLKPGLYWYDKVSGYWGKVGQKPGSIITPDLNVGGTLMRNASNGNTGILINGREITKAERQMLKWAGVHCAGNPHFWLNADGTYQEEGQKNVKGKIWGKTRVKLLCPVLSLPIPSKVANTPGEELNKLSNRPVPEQFNTRVLQKFLLIGPCGSGSSTIFKQAKFLYKSVPFSEEERQDIKLMIQTSIYHYLGLLLEGREWFEELCLTEIREMQQLDYSGDSESIKQTSMPEYSISPRLKSFSDWLLRVMASGNLEAIFPAATREYAPLVEEIWKDSAIQATYKRRNELQSLPSIASYFLERVVDISKVEYEPSDMDILYSDGVTSCNGLACTDFHFPQSASAGSCIDDDDDDDDDHRDTLRYQLIRVQSKGLGENYKWLSMFDDVRVVIFSVALTDYNEYCADTNGIVVNKMMENRKLFECIAGYPAFERVDFLLILSKFDLLEQKIELAPLTLCEWFNDYNPIHSRRTVQNNGTKAQQAFHYIAVKFKRLFYSITRRKLYVTQANGMDPDSIDAALRYAREITKWEEDSLAYCTFESMYSTEPSSYSH